MNDSSTCMHVLVNRSSLAAVANYHSFINKAWYGKTSQGGRKDKRRFVQLCHLLLIHSIACTFSLSASASPTRNAFAIPVSQSTQNETYMIGDLIRAERI